MRSASIAQLPSSIAGWTILADLFDDELAASLLHLMTRLEVAVDTDHVAPHRSGEPDGYSGIDRRGPISRLLLSELALADEIPDEFLRRLAQAEAGYLELNVVKELVAGRLLVVLDSGPDQLGMARIGHLAVILLLWRKSQRLGVDLEVGVIQRPGESMRGSLNDIVVAWLANRTHERIEPVHVAAWTSGLGPDDECWMGGGSDLAAMRAASAGLHTITFTESGVDVDGATDLEVVSHGKRSTVPLPPRDDAIRLLRERGFRRQQSGVVTEPTNTVTSIRHPRFLDATSRLLCRSEWPEVVYSVPVPRLGKQATPQFLRRSFSGPVIAAGHMGTRTVALVYVDQQLTLEIVGKKLADLNGLEVPLSALGLREDELDLIGAKPLAPLLFEGGLLYAQLPSGWWRFGRHGPPQRHPILAAAASDAVDVPFILRPIGNVAGRGVWVQGTLLQQVPDGAPLVIGAGYVGWRVHDSWTLRRIAQPADEVITSAQGEPIGVITTAAGPFLVSLSDGGQLVRLDGRTSRTITALSGDIAEISVHPTKPLIAVQRADGTTIAYDAGSGVIALRFSDGAR